MASDLIITDFERWERAGRGRELQFFASDAEVQDWLTRVLPARYAPYCLVGSDLMKEHSTYVDRPFQCSTSGLVTCMRGGDGHRWQFWLLSEGLSPGLVLERGTAIDKLCSYNGLVLLQHGLDTELGRDSSRIAITDRVRNTDTGEIRSHIEYLDIFRSLRKAIEAALRYSTINQFLDGTEEESSRVRRWTQGAFQAWEAGMPFAARPGRHLPNRKGP